MKYFWIFYIIGFCLNAYIFGMYRWLWLQSGGDRNLYLQLLDALTPPWASVVKIVSYILVYLSIFLFLLSEDYFIPIGLLLFQWFAPMFIPYNFRIYKPIYQKSWENRELFRFNISFSAFVTYILSEL